MNAKAAKPEKVTVAESIREAFKKWGKDIPNKDIIAKLAEDGITAPSAQVSNIRTKLFGSVSGSAKPQAGELTLPKLLSLLDENGGLAGIEKSIKAVEAAQEHQKLIDKLGGAAKAREMIDTIKKLK